MIAKGVPSSSEEIRRAERNRKFKGPFPLQSRREPACSERVLAAAGSLCAVMRVTRMLVAGA